MDRWLASLLRMEGFKGSKAVRGKWVDGSDWLATAAEEAHCTGRLTLGKVACPKGALCIAVVYIVVQSNLYFKSTLMKP